jgi:hypothetical protein
MVTLYPNYIRMLARSYKALRANEVADRKVLETVHQAAERCLRAHMRADLQLAKDVRLPISTVLMMLEYVYQESSILLEPVPQPDDLAPQPLSRPAQSLIRRALDRLLSRRNQEVPA